MQPRIWSRVRLSVKEMQDFVCSAPKTVGRDKLDDVGIAVDNLPQGLVHPITMAWNGQAEADGVCMANQLLLTGGVADRPLHEVGSTTCCKIQSMLFTSQVSSDLPLPPLVGRATVWDVAGDAKLTTLQEPLDAICTQAGDILLQGHVDGGSISALEDDGRYHHRTPIVTGGLRIKL